MSNKQKTGAPRKKSGGVLGALIGFLFAIVILAAAGAGGAWFYARHVYTAEGPASADGADRIVMISPGSSVQTVGARLKEAGVIEDETAFRMAVRFTGAGPRLKAGEYAFASAMSLERVIALLVSGRTLLHPITIPEGLTSAQIMQRLQQFDVLSGELPQVTPAEGVLLPDTYMVHRGDTREAVIARMIQAQQTLISELWPTRQPGLPFETVQDMVKLASIVEKETGVPGERPLVAGVFVNRMRRNMRLETDPTIIYGVCLQRPDSCMDAKLVDNAGRPRGIRASELALDTGYNTYRIDGLPPTPICNPGADAIRAVLDPPVTDALFFVTDGSGGHAFSATYAEHLQHVGRLREREAAARTGAAPQAAD